MAGCEVSSGRLMSIDTLRGADMCLIMGVAKLIIALSMYFGVRTRLALAALLLLGSWALTANVVAPDAPAHAIFDGVVKLCPTGLGNVIFAAGYVAVCWLFLLFLHRKNVFLKA